MASTSKRTPATSSGKSNQASSKRSPKSPNAPKPNKSRGSMGLGLLLIAIGTSLIGLGGLGYWFYQELLSSARREVDTSAEAQARQIDARLSDVKTTVDEVAGGAKILSQQPSKPKGYEPYQRLIVDGLQNKKSIAGMGVASNGNLLFAPAKPLVPYVWREQSGLKTETAGQKLVAPNDKFLSGDRPDIQKASFYQDTLKGQSAWSQPYTALGKTLITYSAPISDGQKVVGIVNADAIASELLSLVDTASYQDTSNESKIGFVVANSSGKVVTASYKFQATQTQNPAIAEALTSLVQQAKAKPSGIVQTGGNLWAYRKIEGSDLLFAAQLPESEITNKLMLPVGVAAVSISAILAIAILLFVNRLKNRLKPLTEECDRYLSQLGNSGVNIAPGKDEIDHLGISLKNTFQQVKNNEISLRNGLNQTLSSSNDDISAVEQLQQNFVETELMEAEVGNLLDVVSSMEEGDLTIEAQVSDRATGLVADTLNRLCEKLVEIISSVLGTAKQVVQGAADLEELAKTVVLNTAEQAQSVAQGQALTEQVAAIAERSSAQVNDANQSLQEVRDTVASGQMAIIALTDSISVLQTGSAQIVQRMKTLGEFVGLAEQFVQDQGQIASLTQVLALNATLVAARAAEQKDPKQFAGVAREFESIAGQVNDLATQTNDGLTVLQQRTSQIQTVVTAIDAEVQNLSGLVAGFTSGVESSQSAFNSIQIATEEVVQIGQAITESSTEIAEAAGSTASYMSEIAQLADRTADLTRSARQQAETMGNQAQRLLQGIQFFRLPESSGGLTHKTSVNSLLDVSTESSNTETNNLGVVVPAIAAATAVTAVSFSPSESSLANTYEAEEDNTATDNKYLENLLDDGVSSDLIDDNAVESLKEQSFDSISENFMSGGITDKQNPDSATYPNLTDISLIEESLLADLKHEVYDDDSSFDEFSPLDDTEPTLKNQLDGVNESSIIEASSDHLIVSATSSFSENIAGGTVSPLAEDANLNLPTFVDFSIPDMDDDFIIPKMNIESTLDNSNSFFDSDNSILAPEVNQADFDPLAMDTQTAEDADEAAIANSDNVFELTESQDYDQFTTNNVINESLEESVESSSNEVFGDSFEMPFDESLFDEDLDEAVNDSVHHQFAVAEDIEEPIPEPVNNELNYELSDQDVNNSFDFGQPVDIYSNNLENQGELSEFPAQIPDIYLEDSSDDEFSEVFNFEIGDDPITKDLSEQTSTEFTFEIDESLSTESSDLGADSKPFDFSTDLQEASFAPEIAIASETDIQLSPVLDLYDQQLGYISDELSEDFSFEIEEDLSTDQMDLGNDDFDSAFTMSQPEIEDISLSSFPESESELAFPSLIDEIENPEAQSSEAIWETDDIASVFGKIPNFQEDLAEDSSFIIDNLNTTFVLPDLSSVAETSDALMGEEFNFDITDDDSNFNIFTNPLERVVEYLVSDSGLNNSEDPPDSVSDAISQTDLIAPDLEEIGVLEENLAESQPSSVADSFSSVFALPDLSLMEESDEALMDEAFDFGMSDDHDNADNFGVSINSLEEEPAIASDEDLLNESGVDLSSVFNDNLEQGAELSYQEFINNSESNFDIDDNTSTFAELTGGLESEDESIKFSEIMDAGNFTDDALEESVIFEAIADETNDLDLESSADSLDLGISQTSNLGLDSEFMESFPDLSLDFSDNWLDKVDEDSDLSSAKFADSDDDISIGYPSEDEVKTMPDGEIYGFADNLLDSLMDEADEEFASLSMDLPDLQTLPYLSNFNEHSVETEDSNSELESDIEFDFSAFDLPIEDSINSARAEIEDFLSGSLDIEEDRIQKKNPPKLVETDNSGSV
jgi:twitching motility protein PilJ